MPQRLTPLEVSLLALDTAHTPGSAVNARGPCSRGRPIPQRLPPLGVPFLPLDPAHTRGHVGPVDSCDAGRDGFDYGRLIGLIRERIPFVPRYRQGVRAVP